VRSAFLRHVPLLNRLIRARDHIATLQRDVATLKRDMELLRNRISDMAARQDRSDNRIGLLERFSLPQAPANIASLDFRDVPIFINSFNRLTCLRRLIGWLQSHGHRRIYIVDNASTYPPLLSYYSEIEATGITIIRLGENVGSRALWERNILTSTGVASEFVYTDSDVVPAPFCPGNVVGHLQSILAAHPEIKKVGIGLRLDEIPSHFRHRDEVLHWEKQFWRWPAARGLMFAPVDTTFALYRPGSEHGQEYTNLRTTYPFLGDHLGWYEDSGNPTEEDRFYLGSARRGVTSWNSGSLRKELVAGLSKVRSARLMHLGCGGDVFPGWLNVDDRPRGDAIRIADFDSLATAFAELPDGSFDGFYGYHVLQRIRDPFSFMQALYRLAKPNAPLVLRLPYGSSDDAFDGRARARALFERSFVYFGQPANAGGEHDYTGDWAISRVKLVLHPEVANLGPDERIWAVRKSRNAVREMIVHLRAIKPSRPSDPTLLDWSAAEFATSELDWHGRFDALDQGMTGNG